MKQGVYVHIPFCAKKCPYCDFYSLPQSREVQERYIDIVVKQMQALREKKIEADTLYFGGGTPTLIGANLLDKIVNEAKKSLYLNGEITLEANPCTVTKELLQQLVEAGFNRISFGLQSAVDSELLKLGRTHTAKQAKQAVLWAKEAGFFNISVDVMLGIPEQTTKTLAKTLAFVNELDVQHVSAYLLKIEQGTGFDCEQVRALIADEDESSELYLQTCKTLAEFGFQQYEISNFSKPNFESKHNLKYWKREEYLAFGPSAHGFFEGVRYEYPRDLSAYLESQGQNTELEDTSGVITAEEYLMLRLRLNEGLDCHILQQEFQANTSSLQKRAKQYETVGLLTVTDSTIALTPKGFLVSNTIIAEFMNLLE